MALELWDLPSDWVTDVVLSAHKRSGLLALFRSCTRFQALILSQSTCLTPKLTFKPKKLRDLKSVVHTRALAFVEHKCSNKAILKLQVSNQAPNTLRLAWESAFAGAAAICASQASDAIQSALLQPQLHCVTSVTLARPQGGRLCLDSLIPEFVVATCPNLQRLQLKRVTITAVPRHSTGSTPDTCLDSLQQLTLKHIYFEGRNPSQAVKQQLRSVPNLAVLDLHANSIEYFKAKGVYRAACQTYSAQLRCLRAVVESNDANKVWLQPQPLPLPFNSKAHFPALLHLDLSPSWSILTDDRLHQLLSAAPNLTSLKLNCISLTHSFAHAPCTWQQLTLHSMNVLELGKLPLSQCTQLACLDTLTLCGQDWPRHEQLPAAADIAAGIAAVRACGGVRFSSCINIQLCSHDLPYLPDAPRLFGSVTDHARVTLCALPGAHEPAMPWALAQELLATLGEHLRCRQVEVEWPGWADNPGAFAQLPQLLPHVARFAARVGQVSVRELLHTCSTASRAFALRLSRVPTGLLEQLEGVMQAAGHCLVSLPLSQELVMSRFGNTACTAQVWPQAGVPEVD